MKNKQKHKTNEMSNDSKIHEEDVLDQRLFEVLQILKDYGEKWTVQPDYSLITAYPHPICNKEGILRDIVYLPYKYKVPHDLPAVLQTRYALLPDPTKPVTAKATDEKAPITRTRITAEEFADMAAIFSAAPTTATIKALALKHGKTTSGVKSKLAREGYTVTNTK